MKASAEAFKALGDETRFEIFLLLAKKRICVRGLANALGISESAVSQHLKVLKRANLIEGEKSGYFIHYRVRGDSLRELEHLIGDLARSVSDSGQAKSAEGLEKMHGKKGHVKENGKEGAQ